MNLSQKKFLMIGGAGLIGSHTVDLLRNEDVKEIIIFDNFTRGSIKNLSESFKDKRVKVFDIGGDILQNDILSKAMEGVDGVFHFAALWLLHCHDYPRSAFRVNVEGFFNILENCVDKKIQKLVWSSSASVYGDSVTEPMDEQHPLNNKNFYGATKIAGEAMANSYHYRYGLSQIGLRYMNVYGPRQDYKGAYIAVIMKMLDAIDNNESPKIYGDGSECFDFVSVKDCASANICAMKSEISNGFYNVGTGVKTSLKQLAEKLCELAGSKKPITYIENKNHTIVKNRIGCTKKSEKEINYKFTIPLEEGLKELIEWRKREKTI